MFKIPLLALYAVTLEDSIFWKKDLTLSVFNVRTWHYPVCPKCSEGQLGQKDTRMEADQKS